jgi:peptidyl-dipeptidase A
MTRRRRRLRIREDFMKVFVLLTLGLLQSTACLAQERGHVRPHTLLPPAASLNQIGNSALRPHAKAPSETRDPKAFVAAAEAELATADEYADRSSWTKVTNITFDTEWLEVRANAARSSVLLDLVKGAARYNGAAVDPETRRKLDLLKLAAAMPPPDLAGGLEELASLTSKLDSLYSTHTVPYQGRTLTRAEAADLALRSTDPVELKALWEGFRANLPALRAPYARSVVLANQGARGLGFNDVGEMWRAGYDMPPDEFAVLVDRLWAQVQPLYESLMCFMRARLSERYGAAEQPRTGPIRHHLVGTGWDNAEGIYFPKTEGDFDLTKLLIPKGYDPIKMVKTAENFYVSLGFDPIPETFYQRSMFTRPKDRDVGCWPNAWTLDGKDDVRLQSCLNVDAEDFYTVHHELGHIVYYRSYKEQSKLFRAGANEGFHEALGDFIALSAQTPTYLHQLGLLEQVPGVESDIPFLLRMLDQHVGAFASDLAVDKWRWDVFGGKVAPEQYNESWWQMQERYRGIAAPVARPADAFDAGLIWHVATHTSTIRYALAQVYQFQFHRAACRIAGWTGPLHRCSIYGNKEVGERLKAMLAMGASQPWPEALAAFTGERELDASAMIEYFAPLQRWLAERNKGEQCGW